jgi:hypothetical protein
MAWARRPNGILKTKTSSKAAGWKVEIEWESTKVLEMGRIGHRLFNDTVWTAAAI